MPDQIWTIGTGHRTIEEFVDLLTDVEIDLVADVRSYPKSHLEHFDRAELERELVVRAVQYTWLGDDLGGLRRGGYRQHMATPSFARGVTRLETLARSQRVAICCAEVEPERCHRRHIADTLVRGGWRVVHLVRPSESREHTILPQQPTLPMTDD